MNNILNHRGMSLVSVIIAAGVVGGLSVAVTQLMQNSNKIVRTTQVGLEALDFEGLLEDTFKNEDACINTFGRVFDLVTPTAELRAGLRINGSNILRNNTFDGKKGVFNANRDVLWSKDELVIGGLELKSISLPTTRLKPDGTTVANFTEISSSPKTGFLELHVRLEKNNQAAKTFGARDKLLKLFLTAELYNDGGTDRINKCQLSGSSTMSGGSGGGNVTVRCTPRVGYVNSNRLDILGHTDFVSCEAGETMVESYCMTWWTNFGYWERTNSMYNHVSVRFSDESFDTSPLPATADSVPLDSVSEISCKVIAPGLTPPAYIRACARCLK